MKSRGQRVSAKRESDKAKRRRKTRVFQEDLTTPGAYFDEKILVASFIITYLSIPNATGKRKENFVGRLCLPLVFDILNSDHLERGLLICPVAFLLFYPA